LNGGQDVLSLGEDLQPDTRKVHFCIFSQKLPQEYFQSYSKVWNCFSKWCRTQLEQDRIILVSDYLQFSSQSQEDNTKQPIVCIMEKFLIKNSMEMKDNIDLSFPTIKLNLAAIAKLAEL